MSEEKEMNKEKEENQEEKDKEFKSSKSSIFWIIGTIAILIALFFLASYIFSRINTIEYNGLTFTKEKFGDISFYHHYYYVTPLLKYNFYIRNDPRKNNVPITGNAVSGGIEFFQSKTTYVSLAPEALVGCEYGSVGLSSLATFLADNQFIVKGASTDEELARESNVQYATCEFRPEETVIEIKNSNETKITIQSPNCYIIEVANCEVLPAIEKFQTQAILDARQRQAAIKNSPA